MNAAQHNTLKKDFGYEILFLKTTIDLNVNVKYVKLQHILHKYMKKKTKKKTPGHHNAIHFWSVTIIVAN